MAALLEVKYFNSFLLKKTTEIDGDPKWNGSFGIPQTIGGYPQLNTEAYGPANWAIEEARIRGGYNNTSVDLGAKAYLVEDEPNGTTRGNSMIYSGIFNSRTGINNTNVFSVGEDITKSVDPSNGTIQKLYAEDTGVIIFQEQKVSRAPIDKDVIYTAEGNSSITASNKVIGDIMPYAGNYGISTNPESFAVYGYRKYFADKNNNVILRLSQDGITELSAYGMLDFFRDKIGDLDSTNYKGKIIGGWDVYNKEYVISLQNGEATPTFAKNYNTLAFDEQVLGWTSFFTYKPDQMFSLQNNFYSIKDGKLWKHYSPSANYGSFYGTQYETSVTFVFNANVSLSKNFQTVNYEGSNGWTITSFISDQTGVDNLDGSYISTSDTTNAILSYVEGSYDNYGNVYPAALYPPLNRAGFDRKENKYFANLVNNSQATQEEVIFGNIMSGIKGYFATVTIATDNATNPGGVKELFAVSTNYANSAY